MGALHYVPDHRGRSSERGEARPSPVECIPRTAATQGAIFPKSREATLPRATEDCRCRRYSAGPEDQAGRLMSSMNYCCYYCSAGLVALADSAVLAGLVGPADLFGRRDYRVGSTQPAADCLAGPS